MNKYAEEFQEKIEHLESKLEQAERDIEMWKGAAKEDTRSKAFYENQSSNWHQKYFESLEEIQTLQSKLEQAEKEKKDLLIGFVKDWYKDNPLVTEERQLAMVDKYLTSNK